MPMRPVTRTITRAQACIGNSGAAPVVLAGGKRRVAATRRYVRLEWLRPGRESWVNEGPRVAQRIAWGKANPVGKALGPAVALLVALTWLATLAVTFSALKR
jgi:hypothetical protein